MKREDKEAYPVDAHPHKAVVEVHPEKSSSKRRCIGYVLLYVVKDHLLRGRAALVIETQLKIRLHTAQ